VVAKGTRSERGAKSDEELQRIVSEKPDFSQDADGIDARVDWKNTLRGMEDLSPPRGDLRDADKSREADPSERCPDTTGSCLFRELSMSAAFMIRRELSVS